MTKSDILAKLEYFNLVHGVTLRAISALSDQELDYRPKPNMRTPREIVFHIYTQELLVEAVRSGQFNAETASRSNPEDPSVASEVKALSGVNALRAYAEKCHRYAENIIKSMSEEELNRPVESPYGTFPVWRFFEFAYDEHWHHRGQLYTYLRLLGKEPTMLYDYQ
jgi:uncharacterized damage-inducible protein DinB